MLMQVPGLPSCILLPYCLLPIPRSTTIWLNYCAHVSILLNQVTYSPLWVNIFHDVLKSKLTSKIKPSNLQIHKCTHFTQLYIAGNFPYMTDVVRISGREWVSTRPYSPSEPFQFNRLSTKLAK